MHACILQYSMLHINLLIYLDRCRERPRVDLISNRTAAVAGDAVVDVLSCDVIVAVSGMDSCLGCVDAVMLSGCPCVGVESIVIDKLM